MIWRISKVTFYGHATVLLKIIAVCLRQHVCIFLFSGTPATFETPATIHGTPAPSQSIPDTDCRKTVEAVETENVPSKNKDESDSTLDRFLAKNTSEDNASFEQIVETSRQKHREKYQWLYEREKEQIERKEKILALPASEDGDQFKYEDRPAMIETWNYTNKNALMYYPDGVDASVQEKIDGKYTKRQQILHSNSRFSKDPFPDESCEDKLADAAATRVAKQQGKIGVDGLVQGGNETPKVKGYGFVATPSPVPGMWMLWLLLLLWYNSKVEFVCAPLCSEITLIMMDFSLQSVSKALPWFWLCINPIIACYVIVVYPITRVLSYLYKSKMENFVP